MVLLVSGVSAPLVCRQCFELLVEETRPMSEVEVEDRSHYKVTFAVLTIGMIAYSLLQSMVSPVLSTIQVDLHTTQATVTWVLTAYLLSASIFTPVMGRIGDAVGKERMLLVTLGALVVGSLLAAVAHSIGLMIVARVIQGIG